MTGKPETAGGCWGGGGVKKSSRICLTCRSCRLHQHWEGVWWRGRSCLCKQLFVMYWKKWAAALTMSTCRVYLMQSSRKRAGLPNRVVPCMYECCVARVETSLVFSELWSSIWGLQTNGGPAKHPHYVKQHNMRLKESLSSGKVLLFEPSPV